MSRLASSAERGQAADPNSTLRTPDLDAGDQMTRVLVVGGGYAGFYTAWHLEKRLRPAEAVVVVVGPRPSMTYQPFLPEVTAGSVEVRHAAVSHRPHLRRTTLLAGSVTSIRHTQKQVTVRLPDGEPRTLDYDIIVVTSGAVTRRFPIPGVAKQAIGLKHVEEAVAIRDRLLVAFDRASVLPPGPERRRLLTVTFVGGEFTWVAGFGELLSLATALVKSYTELTSDDSTWSRRVVGSWRRCRPDRARGWWTH